MIARAFKSAAFKVAPDFATTRPMQGRSVSFRAREPPNLRGLYPFQAAGVAWLYERERALLADEMGLGKTIQLLRAIPNTFGAFVCAPALLLKTWERLAARWRPDLQVSVGAKRPCAGELVVESYDSLPDAWPREDWSSVELVLDEAQYVKTPSADRTRKVRELAARCGRVKAATGTPIHNHLVDLYEVLVSAQLADRLMSRSAFRRAGATELRERLADVMLRRTRAEVLPQLPRKTYQEVMVPLSEDVRVALDSAEAAWRTFGVDELPPFELLASAMTALAIAKTPFVCDYVRVAAEKGPVVVFAAHEAPVLALGELGGARAIVGATSRRERQAAIDGFQRGDFSILALTIGVGGVGLTLTRSSHVLFVDRAYTPSENEQAEDRLARIGSEANKILVTRFISEHVLDRRLTEILDAKQRVNAEVLG